MQDLLRPLRLPCLIAIIVMIPLVLSLWPVAAQSGSKRIYIAPDDHTDYLWLARLWSIVWKWNVA